MAKDAESLKIKSDDIDGCLAADFDGSLSGLGVEIVSNTYNMSEALEALPSLFKQETENGLLLHKITPLLTNHHLHLTSAAIHNNIINNNYHNSNINNLKINSTFIKRKINNDNKVNNKSNNNNNNSPISMEKLTTTKEKIQPQEQLYTHSDAIFTYHIDEDDEEEDEDFVLKEDDYFFNEENIDVIHSDNNIDNVFSNNNNLYYNNNNVNINTSIQTNSMVGVGNDNLNNKITLSADELFFNPCNDFINNNNHTYNHNHNYNNNNDNYSTSNNNNTANIASDNHTHDKNAGMPILLSNPILFNNTTSITTLSSATNSSTQLLNNKQLPTNNFNYILKAATSAGCRTIDEPITYLNQGQWYEVVLRSSSTSHNNLKSTIRLQVNNNRLQHQQQHIISNWSLNRPGEVMLQLDRSITGDTHNDTTDNINSVTFDWSLYNHHHHHQYHQQHRHLRILPLHSPDRNMASVFIKINCISSEFTPNKHGGEKGIPFKLQIETRVDDELHHVASCQVKVFKIKGADRKNKQERSRREKMAPHEREKYQECSEVTSFFEIPVNKIFNQNNNNNITRNNKKKNNNNDIIDKNNENNNNNNNNNNKNNTRGIVMSNGNSNDGINTITEEMVFLLPSSNKNNNNNNNNIIKTKKNNKIIIGNSTVTGISTAFTTSLLASNDIHNNNNNNNMNAINKRNNISNNKLVNDVNIESISGAASINSRKRPLPDLCPTPLQASSTPEQAALWLSSNRFHDLLDVFENFSGCDLLCLSKDELAQICGLATGIRLYNLLHAKNLQPKLTIFVCHVIDTEYWSNIVPSVDLKQTLHDQQHNTAPSQQPIIPQLVAYNPQQHQQNVGLLLQHVPATQQVLEDRVEDLQAPALSNEHTDSLIRADHNYGVTTEPSNKIPPFKFDLINTKLSTTAHTTIQLNTASLSRDHTELALTSSQDIKADDKQLSEQNDDVIVLEKDDADQIALNSKQPDLPQKTTLAEVSIEHNLTSKHDLDETTLDPIMTPNNPPCYVILPSQNKNDGEDDGVGSEGNIGGDGGGVGGNGDGDSDDGIVGGGVCGGLDINAVCGDGSSGLGYDDDSGINSRGVASDGGDVSVCSRGDFEFTEEKNGTDILKSLSIAAEVHVTSANTAVKQPADELTAAKPSSNTLTASELTADSMTFEEKSTLPLISTTKTFSISSIFSSIFLPPTSTFASTKIFDATTMLIPTTTPTATQDQTQQKIKSSISPPTTQTHIPLKPITITRPKTTTTPLNASTTKLPTPIATSNLFSKKQPTATKPSTSTKPPTTTKTTTSRLPPQLTPACSCKRSISDFDEGVSSLMKKQRIVPSNHSPQQVFHAIYLNDLSLSHLLYKLASLFPLPATLVSQLLIRNSMGFYYLVDDSVVQNMREQSSYVIELSPDENKPGYFKILLKSIGF